MTRFTLKASRLLTVSFTGAHTAAAAVILPLQIPLPVKAALWVLIGVSLAHVLLRHALLLTASAIVAGAVTDPAEATLECRNGRESEAQILGTSYVTPTLTVLNLRENGALLPRHILLVADNIHPEDFRELRVLLRWGSPARG